MATMYSEYRYSAAASGRARLFLVASLALVAALLVALIAGRQGLNALSLGIGFVLLVVVLSTARAQLGRIGFVLRLGPDRLEVTAPLSNRSIDWSEIVQVRRIAAPRVFGPPGWACAVVLRGRRGNQPVFLFDSSLERAEQAYNDIVARSKQGMKDEG